MKLTVQEINRKALHIVSGTLIPAGIFYLPLLPGVGRWVPAAILAVLAAGSLGLEFARLRYPAVQKYFYAFAGKALREQERASLTGSTWIFLSAFLCAVIFLGREHIAFMALSMFILGDAVAALVGISIGRVRIGKKSLEGSLACFFLCLVLMLLVFPHVPLLLEAWGGTMPMGIAIAAALSTTFFELFPLRLTPRIVLNDNLSVPVITGIVMNLMWTAGGA